MKMPQYRRKAHAAMVRAISTVPSGSEAVVGRGFEMIRTELYQLNVTLCGEDNRDEIEEDTQALDEATDQLERWSKSLR